MTISREWLWLLIIDHHYNRLLIGMRSIVNDNDCLLSIKMFTHDSNVQSCRLQAIKTIDNRRSRRFQADDQDDPEQQLRRSVLVTVDQLIVKLANNCWQ